MSGNPMRDQILATPAALKAAFDELELAVRLVLSFEEIFRSRRIVLTGSGDSYFAAAAAEFAFLKHAGLPVEVRTPLDAGRYHAAVSRPRDIENTLVVALSNSGGAARTAEAAGLYRARGALVLALTKDRDSRLAAAADKTLVTPVPTLPPAPGYGAYLFALLALQLLAIRLGEVRAEMTMDQAQALRMDLKRHLDDLAAVTEATDAPARSVADKLQAAALIEFLGAGPSRAVADYGAAKILEACGRHALARDLEEWVHLNYFDGAPAEIATMAILPVGSRATSRVDEVAAYWAKLRANFTVVGGPMDGAAALPVQPAIAEEFSPLLTSVGPALVTAHLSELLGADYGRGATGPWSDCRDAATVQGGRIETSFS
ncbi:SIS domain-containing protein [Consotaella aegiceratis]|uniref:SIS domain-containing protein n=1 Tax=Consotaella aegiceratis TaxID=3097961 RepID=UPI002F3F065F